MVAGNLDIPCEVLGHGFPLILNVDLIPSIKRTLGVFAVSKPTRCGTADTTRMGKNGSNRG
jgi:hypothetical protein